MKVLAATIFSLALAASSTRRGAPHTCPGGLTNSSPLCCSLNIAGILALDCISPPSNGCTGSMKPQCCTLGLAGQDLLCNDAIVDWVK